MVIIRVVRAREENVNLRITRADEDWSSYRKWLRHIADSVLIFGNPDVQLKL